MSDISDNEVVVAFRLIANHIDMFKLDWKKASQFIRKCSDEYEAQAKAVILRDEMNEMKMAIAKK